MVKRSHGRSDDDVEEAEAEKAEAELKKAEVDSGLPPDEVKEIEAEIKAEMEGKSEDELKAELEAAEDYPDEEYKAGDLVETPYGVQHLKHVDLENAMATIVTGAGETHRFPLNQIKGGPR